MSESIEIGSIVKLKNSGYVEVVNINFFREPSLVYAGEMFGFKDLIFFGDENIEKILEVKTQGDQKMERLTPPEEYERQYVLRKIKGMIYEDSVDPKTLKGTRTLNIYIEDLFDYFNVTKVKVTGIGEYKEYEKTY